MKIKVSQSATQCVSDAEITVSASMGRANEGPMSNSTAVAADNAMERWHGFAPGTVMVKRRIVSGPTLIRRIWNWLTWQRSEWTIHYVFESLPGSSGFRHTEIYQIENEPGT
jgi:hypothetical protein